MSSGAKKPSSVNTLMEAAAEVAQVAGRHAMRWYRSSDAADVDIKADGSPVTVADRESELLARKWISERFPSDGIIGEEFDDANPDASRKWIIDPIDGTKAFVRGVPLWGTLVACCEGETVLAGAAFFPAVDELAFAAPGEGCWWNGVRAGVSSVNDLAYATALTTDDRFPPRTLPAGGSSSDRARQWSSLAGAVGVARTWGDCYGYLLVATGRAEIMVDDIVNPWDAAALQPIVEEAGGVFTGWNGVRTAFSGSAIATNSALARPVRVYLHDSHDSP